MLPPPVGVVRTRKLTDRLPEYAENVVPTEVNETLAGTETFPIGERLAFNVCVALEVAAGDSSGRHRTKQTTVATAPRRRAFDGQVLLMFNKRPRFRRLYFGTCRAIPNLGLQLID